MRKNIYRYGRRMNEGADCCAEQIFELRNILIGKEYWNDETNDDGIPGIIDSVDVTGPDVVVNVIEDDGFTHREKDIAKVLDCIDLTADEYNAVQDALRCIADQDCDEVEYRESKRDRKISKADAISRYSREIPESYRSARAQKASHISESYDVSILKDILVGAQCYDDDGRAGRNGENGEIIDVRITDGCPIVVVEYDGKIFNGKLSDCIDYIVLSERDKAVLEDYLDNLECDECYVKECGVDECDDIKECRVKECDDKRKGDEKLYSARRAKNECGGAKKPRVNESIATNRKRIFTAMDIRNQELKKERSRQILESMNYESRSKRTRNERNKHI